MTDNLNEILVIGAGSWGTALALVLARNGHTVYLWDCEGRHIANLARDRCNNHFLPGFDFPECLKPTSDIQGVMDKSRDLIIAVPCESLRDVLTRVAGLNPGRLNMCLASKGLEPETHKLNHLVVKDYLDDVRIAVLSGPSFAVEVASGLPTAVTIAADDETTAGHFSDLFHNELFRIYTHDDIVGVQIGGAVKNVMAIAAGIADGLGFGANTRAALISRGLAEITRLGVAMGGRQETFMGLAGLGDLVLTCTDDHSRNRRLGLALARGDELNKIREEIGQVIEGIRTAEAVHELRARFNIEMPISEQIYKVLKGDSTPREGVQALLQREPKSELY